MQWMIAHINKLPR